MLRARHIASRRWCLCFALAACGGGNDRPAVDAAPLVDAPQIACPSSAAVSFKTDVAPLIGHCSGEACHGLSTRLLTWPYQALVNMPADCGDGRVIVKPGDPGASYLVDKLLGSAMCKGDRMPLLGAPLPAASMTTIEAWICQGAANN
jgi:hypothetical protein